MRTFKASALALGLTIAIGSTTAVFSPPAHALDYAREWTQVMNNIQLVQSYITQADQLQQQIRMYEDMVKQGMQVPDTIWSEAKANLAQLDQLVRSSRALAYNADNVADKLKELYPGYGAYANGDADFDRWTRNMDSTVETVLENSGLQADQFETEADTMRRLEQQSASAEGRLQAIQAGNSMAAQTFGQLQKLRQLIMAQTELQAQRIAAANDQSAAVKAYLEKTYATKPRENTERTGGY
jgi:P-type conjugative transfer protein TrbJ